MSDGSANGSWGAAGGPDAAGHRGPSFAADYSSPQGPATPAPADPYGSGSPYGQPGAQYPSPLASTGDPYGGYGQPAVGSPHNPVPPSPYGYPASAQGGSYGSPYGSYGQPYGVYGYSAPAKSKTTAALLAFFLGGIGIHNFYLGQKGRGFGHVALAVGCLILFIIGVVAAASAPSGRASDAMVIPALLGYLGWMVNGLWAFVEFIIILVKPEHELGK